MRDTLSSGKQMTMVGDAGESGIVAAAAAAAALTMTSRWLMTFTHTHTRRVSDALMKIYVGSNLCLLSSYPTSSIARLLSTAFG